MRTGQLYLPRPNLLRSAFHERAAAFVERPEGLIGWDRGELLVEIPRALGLSWLLDLEQIGRMDLPPILPHTARTEAV